MVTSSHMKVAIVHYWLVGMRGGERVLEALCDLYPEADLYTHVYLPEAVSRSISCHKVTTTFVGRLPFAATMYKKYLPLMPMALEQLDLSGYDLVISSESGPAKGVIAHPDAVHVCYCHSPMRYIWNLYHQYRSDAGMTTRLLMPALAHYLRGWDQTQRRPGRCIRGQFPQCRPPDRALLRSQCHRRLSTGRYRIVSRRLGDTGR